MNKKIPVEFWPAGLSDDARANRWKVACGSCGRNFNPPTTLRTHQEFDCPRCGAFHRADWNNDNVFHIKEG